MAVVGIGVDMMMVFLEEYMSGSHDNDPAWLQDNVEQRIFEVQDSERFKSLIDKLYYSGDGELSFLPDDNTLVRVYRDEDDGTSTYHFDLYTGENNSEYFLGSRCGGASLYTLHISPYANGKANGINRDITFRSDREYVKQMATLMERLHISPPGEIPTKDSNEEVNWCPKWSEQLQ